MSSLREVNLSERIIDREVKNYDYKRLNTFVTLKTKYKGKATLRETMAIENF